MKRVSASFSICWPFRLIVECFVFFLVPLIWYVSAQTLWPDQVWTWHRRLQDPRSFALPLADPGESPPTPLIFRPNWGPRGPKNFFWRPPLSQSLDPALTSATVSGLSASVTASAFDWMGPIARAENWFPVNRISHMWNLHRSSFTVKTFSWILSKAFSTQVSYAVWLSFHALWGHMFLTCSQPSNAYGINELYLGRSNTPCGKHMSHKLNLRHVGQGLWGLFDLKMLGAYMHVFNGLNLLKSARKQKAIHFSEYRIS